MVLARQPERATAIGAYRLRVTFDATQLAYVDHADSIGMTSVKATGDTVLVSGIAAGTGFADGKLVTLQFRVLGSGGIRSTAMHVDELTDVAFIDRRAAFGLVTGTMGVAAQRNARAALVSGGVRRGQNTPTPPSIYGDANDDGIIGVTDALIALTKAVGLPVSGGYDSLATDASGDGTVTAFDAQIILAYTVGTYVPGARLGDVVGSLPVHISTVAPSLLLPGTAATITGTNFDTVATNDSVTIDSVPAVVTSASPTQLTVTIPSSLPCSVTHSAKVVVRVSGANGRAQQSLRVATSQVSLAVGATMVVTDSVSLRCQEFPGTASYLITVYDTTREWAPSATSFTMATSLGPVAPSSSSNLLVPSRQAQNRVTPRQRSIWKTTPAGTALRNHALAHLRVMERDRQLLRHVFNRYGSAAIARHGAKNLLGAPRPALSVSSVIGTNSTLRIMSDTDANKYTIIRARTAYVGTHCIIVEDSTSPTANKIDAFYAKLGAEFDNVMYPILVANFGDPLLMDANLSNTGKIVMVFTPVINKQYPGLLAFVTPCDFLKQSACGSSNVGEFFYAEVPEYMSSGYAYSDPYDIKAAAGWYNYIRGTLIHESKHITAAAQKFSQSPLPVLEESWLEEGTAQIAAELYDRAVHNGAWKSNLPYSPTMSCEIRLCSGYSLNLLNHFGWLYDYVTSPYAASPIDPGWYDPTIYGSGWLLVRWALDQYATSESAFLKALIQEPTLVGADNLEARTGVPWATVIGGFSLAMAADDFTAASGIGTSGPTAILSWNVPNVMNGLTQDLGLPWGGVQTPGLFQGASVGSVTPGGAKYFRLIASGRTSAAISLQPGVSASPLQMMVVRTN